MRVVTARMLSALLRSPNPTNRSAPGQPNRPRAADPAAMQTTIGTREHAKAEASMGYQQLAMLFLTVTLHQLGTSLLRISCENAWREMPLTQRSPHFGVERTWQLAIGDILRIRG